jgi:hypothetical protein
MQILEISCAPDARQETTAPNKIGDDWHSLSNVRLAFFTKAGLCFSHISLSILCKEDREVKRIAALALVVLVSGTLIIACGPAGGVVEELAS